jgi:hypothetical protein
LSRGDRYEAEKLSTYGKKGDRHKDTAMLDIPKPETENQALKG